MYVIMDIKQAFATMSLVLKLALLATCAKAFSVHLQHGLVIADDVLLSLERLVYIDTQQLFSCNRLDHNSSGADLSRGWNYYMTGNSLF